MTMELEIEVTKAHREIAMTALGVELPLKHEYGRVFIETGEDKSDIYPCTKRFALALATFEFKIKNKIDCLFCLDKKTIKQTCSLCGGDWDNGRMSCMGCNHGFINIRCHHCFK